MLVCCVLAPASQGNAQPPLGGNALGDLRTVGHEPDINPALRRFTGIVVALGDPDAAGHVYTFRVAPIGPLTVAPLSNELRGWRLTVLAGKRFASVFRVQSNTATEITVKATDGTLETTLDGLAAGDVFVIEEIDDSVPEPSASALTLAARRLAAHHLQHGSRDVRRIRIRREEHVRGRELLRLRRPAHRHVAAELRDLLGRSAAVGGVERRPYRARRDRIHPNAALDQILRQRLGEAR